MVIILLLFVERNHRALPSKDVGAIFILLLPGFSTRIFHGLPLYNISMTIASHVQLYEQSRRMSVLILSFPCWSIQSFQKGKKREGRIRKPKKEVES